MRCATGDTDFGWLSQFLEAWTTDGIAVPLDPAYIVRAMDAIRDAIVDTVAEDPTLGAFIRELLTLHVRGQLDTETVEELVQAARRR